ncbi:phage portal protein [Antiquaquibacter oligotrophicus]|nr:phage portal protein [Antiquaquibacter oligotrophicus]UDF14710.1 phage portal protein [Antiquaquibacter oligotrophicus]
MQQVASYFGFASRFSDSSHLAQITLDDWLGSLPDAVAVNRSNAMSIATISAGRNTIAGVAGGLTLLAEKGSQPAPVQPSILEGFERGIPMATTLTWTFDDLIFYPCSWWVVRERDFYNWPIWGERVDHSRTRLDSFGRLTHVDGEEVKPQDVIRFDSPLGDGLLVNGRRTIKRAIALDISAALAEDNPVPSVELHNEGNTPMDERQRKQLISDWIEARRKSGVGYTPKGLKVVTHGLAPQQLLIDGRRAISLDAARHMNLPAWAVSTAVEGATMTYDNRSMRNWELIDLTLGAYFTAVAGRLSMPDVTPRGWKVRINPDELTRPDEKTRFDTYKVGLDGDFIDREWIAAREGWPRIMGGTQQ